MNRIKHLVDLNASSSTSFLNQALDRSLYRSQHPTEIAVLKCMDGRLHLPIITQTPLGIIRPFRNLGGRFNLGWAHFQTTLNEWVSYAISRARPCLVLVTYHFSRGDAHRGCRGFDYNTDAALLEMATLKQQISTVFKGQAVTSIVCGIETDLDALILHGENGERVDLSELNETASSAELKDLIKRLYPSMPEQVQTDFLPLLAGNLKHIKEIRASNRPNSEVEHKEWMIGIGSGFDWLHEINAAFLVGPYSPDITGPIKTAAILLQDNIVSGRVNGADGLVLMTSAAYRKPVGPDRQLAIEKTKFLSAYARDVIEAHTPDLLKHLEVLTAVVDMNTRKLEIL
ncbi:MAG: hypothetical protein JWO40_172 [Candidatus Doudnabacteria bacterium]|nr:hypothetical protein [Candidatus Doudnabacteria bacterium]